MNRNEPENEFKNTDLQVFDNSSYDKACVLQKINIFDANGN